MENNNATLSPIEDLALSTLGHCLTFLQSKCIGIFILGPGVRPEMVVNETEYGFTSISISDYLGLSTSTYGKEGKEIKRFPDNKSLTEMKADPFAFTQWLKDNGIS